MGHFPGRSSVLPGAPGRFLRAHVPFLSPKSQNHHKIIARDSFLQLFKQIELFVILKGGALSWALMENKYEKTLENTWGNHWKS